MKQGPGRGYLWLTASWSVLVTIAWTLYFGIVLFSQVLDADWSEVPWSTVAFLLLLGVWWLLQTLQTLVLCCSHHLPPCARGALAPPGHAAVDTTCLPAWLEAKLLSPLISWTTLATFVELGMFQYTNALLTLVAFVTQLGRCVCLYYLLCWQESCEVATQRPREQLLMQHEEEEEEGGGEEEERAEEDEEAEALSEGPRAGRGLLYVLFYYFEQRRRFLNVVFLTLVYILLQHLCLVAWLFVGGPPVIPQAHLSAAADDVAWVMRQLRPVAASEPGAGPPDAAWEWHVDGFRPLRGAPGGGASPDWLQALAGRNASAPAPSSSSSAFSFTASSAGADSALALQALAAGELCHAHYTHWSAYLDGREWFEGVPAWANRRAWYSILPPVAGRDFSRFGLSNPPRVGREAYWLLLVQTAESVKRPQAAGSFSPTCMWVCTDGALAATDGRQDDGGVVPAGPRCSPLEGHDTEMFSLQVWLRSLVVFGDGWGCWSELDAPAANSAHVLAPGWALGASALQGLHSPSREVASLCAGLQGALSALWLGDAAGGQRARGRLQEWEEMYRVQTYAGARAIRRLITEYTLWELPARSGEGRAQLRQGLVAELGSTGGSTGGLDVEAAHWLKMGRRLRNLGLWRNLLTGLLRTFFTYLIIGQHMRSETPWDPFEPISPQLWCTGGGSGGGGARGGPRRLWGLNRAAFGAAFFLVLGFLGLQMILGHILAGVLGVLKHDEAAPALALAVCSVLSSVMGCLFWHKALFPAVLFWLQGVERDLPRLLACDALFAHSVFWAIQWSSLALLPLASRLSAWPWFLSTDRLDGSHPNPPAMFLLLSVAIPSLLTFPLPSLVTAAPAITAATSTSADMDRRDAAPGDPRAVPAAFLERLASKYLERRGFATGSGAAPCHARRICPRCCNCLASLYQRDTNAVISAAVQDLRALTLHEIKRFRFTVTDPSHTRPDPRGRA